MALFASQDATEPLFTVRVGEWSDWVPIVFETGLPGSTVVGAMGLPTSLHSIIRLYVKEVHPNLSIYVSPLQIDPANPANRAVVDLELDHGPIVIQRSVPVLADDDEDRLSARILEQEHIAYPEALKALLTRRWDVVGRRVVFI